MEVLFDQDLKATVEGLLTEVAFAFPSDMWVNTHTHTTPGALPGPAGPGQRVR